MIKFENGALTTDATLSVADSQAIFQFADYCVQMEKERIIKLLDTVEGHDAMIIAFEGEPEMKTLIKLIKGEK